MNRQERAKQFMPFDALKGLQEELRKKEVEREKSIITTLEGKLENDSGDMEEKITF